MKCKIILQKESEFILDPALKRWLHQMISAAHNVGVYVTPF